MLQKIIEWWEICLFCIMNNNLCKTFFISLLLYFPSLSPLYFFLSSSISLSLSLYIYIYMHFLSLTWLLFLTSLLYIYVRINLLEHFFFCGMIMAISSPRLISTLYHGFSVWPKLFGLASLHHFHNSFRRLNHPFFFFWWCVV